MQNKKVNRLISVGITMLFFIFSMVVVSADECDPDINLPNEPVKMLAWEFPSDIFGAYKIVLGEISGDLDVYNGAYPGWCVDFGTDIHIENQPHQVQLYSSYDPALPERLDHENWSLVNYLINNRGEANPVEVQLAIYQLINFGPWEWDHSYGPIDDLEPDYNVVDSLVTNTVNNANGWCPDEGDKIAVICDPGVEHPFQITFIEVVLGSDGPFMCAPFVNLPISSVDLFAEEFPDDWFAAYKIDLEGISGEYNVMDGPYYGWCVDFGTSIDVDNQPHKVKLYSSYDPALPERLNHVNWSLVNYLINNRGGADPVDVQRAIYKLINFGEWSWDYTGYGPMGDTINDAVVNSLINEAETMVNDGWCPGCGYKIAVICDPGVEHPFQITFIEVVLCVSNPTIVTPEPIDEKQLTGTVSGTTNKPPVAIITLESSMGLIGEEFVFDGSKSTDDGTIEKWSWRFGDGTTASGEIVTHQYTDDRTFSVELTVTDDRGQTDKDLTKVVILKPNTPPNRPIITGPKSGSVDSSLVFSFTAIDIDDDLIRYMIDWGDGSSNITNYAANDSTIQSNHIWETSGLYKISVYAEDEYNATSQTNTKLVMIDVTVSFIDDTIKGYLLDSDNDGIFEVFHNNGTMSETAVETQSDGSVLIDSDGDDTWDYSYSVSGLIPYAQQVDTSQQVNNEMPWWLILIALIIAIFIVLLVFVKMGIIHIELSR